ncbi:MFS transporter [Spirochaeta cellobiosiphila]|uniref:MFS transporter n=1 Tax=Spirochaeta cellobiosiphila TaxID=504483 RepID=UPI00041DAD4B|nr:MFS transporter [Spirochaeta cellobiosiphila]
MGLSKNRSLWNLVIGQSISELGNQFGYIALIAVIYEQTSNFMNVGVLLIIKATIRIVVSPGAGFISDRISSRHMLIGSDLIRFMLTISILFIHNTYIIYIIVALITMAEVCFTPAFAVYLTQTVEDHELLKANAFYAFSTDLMTVIGPALAGVTISIIGTRWGLIGDSLTFGIAALFMFFISSKEKVEDIKLQGSKMTISDLNGHIIVILILGVLLMLYGGAANVLMMPMAQYLSDDFERTLGVLFSCIGTGFLIGSFLVLKSGFSVFQMEKGISLSMVLFALVSLGFTFGNSIIFVGVFCLVNGIANSLFSINSNTLLMKSSRPDIRGMITGLDNALSNGASIMSMSLGSLLLAYTSYQNIFKGLMLFPILGFSLMILIKKLGNNPSF